MWGAGARISGSCRWNLIVMLTSLWLHQPHLLSHSCSSAKLYIQTQCQTLWSRSIVTASYGSGHITYPGPGNFNRIWTTAMTLRSVPIILSLTSILILTRTGVQPYSVNYHIYPYTAGHGHTQPFTIVGLLEIGYVSLRGSCELTPTLTFHKSCANRNHKPSSTLHASKENF
jgi:hypothetical protein